MQIRTLHQIPKLLICALWIQLFHQVFDSMRAYTCMSLRVNDLA